VPGAEPNAEWYLGGLISSPPNRPVSLRPSACDPRRRAARPAPDDRNRGVWPLDGRPSLLWISLWRLLRAPGPPYCGPPTVPADARRSHQRRGPTAVPLEVRPLLGCGDDSANCYERDESDLVSGAGDEHPRRRGAVLRVQCQRRSRVRSAIDGGGPSIRGARDQV